MEGKKFWTSIEIRKQFGRIGKFFNFEIKSKEFLWHMNSKKVVSDGEHYLTSLIRNE